MLFYYHYNLIHFYRLKKALPRHGNIPAMSMNYLFDERTANFIEYVKCRLMRCPCRKRCEKRTCDIRRHGNAKRQHICMQIVLPLIHHADDPNADKVRNHFRGNAQQRQNDGQDKALLSRPDKGIDRQFFLFHRLFLLAACN